MVFTLTVCGAFVALVVVAFVHLWSNRPYRGPGADTASADEAALRASKFVTRGPPMGSDIGTDL